MIKSFTKEASISEMHKAALEDGVFLIENYLEGETLEALRKEVLRQLKINGINYRPGRALRGNHLSAYYKDNPIRQVFSQKWMYELYLMITEGKDKGYGKSIYANHDYRMSTELERNGWLHFDRNSCWKYFIYLSDIEKDGGAFSIVPGSHKIGKTLHTEAWKVTKNYGDVKNRIELDYPEIYENTVVTPIEMPAGTLIAFDTNCFHRGGLILKEGKERLVVRLNNFK